MATPNQKADFRPISFIFHNTTLDRPPEEVPLVIRPEDLTRTDSSRLTTTQTLGGSWADNFGKGLPTVQIAGHTGWGAGDRKNGLQEFIKLHKTIFERWHIERAEALRSGLDPDKVKLVFIDGLDEFEWVVAPQNFVLKRNKSRPLLSQYQITLTYLSNDVAETKAALLKKHLDMLEKDGLASLLNSIKQIGDFIKSKITGFLGPIKAAFDSFVQLTANVLDVVKTAVATVKGVVGAVTNGLMGIAISLTKAAANITRTVQAIVSLPQQIKAQFSRVAAAFNNAFCVMRNVFTKRKFIPNYDDLFGASNCSSTAGGRPISKYSFENPFPTLYPNQTSGVSVTSSANAALGRLGRMDPVQNAPSSSQLISEVQTVNTGVSAQGVYT